MARHVMRSASLVFVATLAMLSGCATSPKTHHLKNVIAAQQRAENAYENGDLTQALAGYEALTRTLPDNVDFWFRLGNIHVRMEQPDQAVTAYEHVLHLDAEHAKAWHNLGIVRLRQAAAAFTQSAHTAGANDPELSRASAQMAHSLATLAGPAGEEVPVTKAADGHDGEKAVPITRGATP